MLNVWLSSKEIRQKFPVNAKVKIDWSGHPLDGASGLVQGYAFFGRNRLYILEIEVSVWTTLHGMVIHQLPWNRLVRI